jgi:hypothetical protein
MALSGEWIGHISGDNRGALTLSLTVNDEQVFGEFVLDDSTSAGASPALGIEGVRLCLCCGFAGLNIFSQLPTHPSMPQGGSPHL